MFRDNPDKILIFSVLALLIFGLVMIASSSVIYSQTRFGEEYYFLKRQFFFGFLPGMAALYFFQKVDYRIWKRFTFLFFLISLVLLVLVFVPGIGTKVYGANRWIQLGPVSFQPSEMAKLSIIIYLAAWLEKRGKRMIRDVYEGLLPFLGIMGLVSFLIIKQPDTGTLGIIILTMITMFFVSGASLAHLASLFILGLISLALIIKMEPYRLNRFMTFLNRDIDPRGLGYHINQALLAIGSGGIWGLGLGHSRQKFNYLPEPMGDSIFAIIGEELGMIGCVAVVILFLAIFLRGIKIASRAPDDFGKLLAAGIVSWIIIQAFVNIASITAIIPLTGVPLPFISYGGTSLIFLMAGVGILLNISRQAKL